MRARSVYVALPALLGLLTAAGPAGAVEVFLNGVRATGLKNQSFAGCQVRFDAEGNLHITAKGYSVKRLEPAPGDENPAAPGTLSGSYFLYSRATRPGYAQYDVDVYINGKWVQKLRNSESEVVTEITSRLRPGKNVVHFAATKSYGGQARLSSSPADHVQVVIGAGQRGGGTVNITSTLASFKASASTTANFGEEQTVTVK